VKNFTRTTLEHLSKYGLQPSPSRIFDERRKEHVFPSDFLCYPWLIVEHKKDAAERKEEECYCQAANAASASLKMHQILAKYAQSLPEDAHVPPITAMTTVGKIVKIWIAYVSNFGRDTVSID
jgi:hypothetical protein